MSARQSTSGSFTPSQARATAKLSCSPKPGFHLWMLLIQRQTVP